jgi:hypothetical protein
MAMDKNKAVSAAPTNMFFRYAKITPPKAGAIKLIACTLVLCPASIEMRIKEDKLSELQIQPWTLNKQKQVSTSNSYNKE